MAQPRRWPEVVWLDLSGPAQLLPSLAGTHGNTPQDARIYGLSEDGFIFIYAPEQADENKARESYVPFTRGLVRRHHAEYVKSLVDDVVSAIINSLSEEHKVIARGFRDRPLLWKESDGRFGLRKTIR